MRRCRCFSPSPILTPSERAKSWRGVYRPARHKTSNDFYAKRARGKPHLRIHPDRRFMSLRRKKEKRNNFAFGISSKLVYRQAEQKARRGIAKTVQARGKILTPQTINSAALFQTLPHILGRALSDEKNLSRSAKIRVQNTISAHNIHNYAAQFSAYLTMISVDIFENIFRLYDKSATKIHSQPILSDRSVFVKKGTPSISRSMRKMKARKEHASRSVQPRVSRSKRKQNVRFSGMKKGAQNAPSFSLPTTLMRFRSRYSPRS